MTTDRGDNSHKDQLTSLPKKSSFKAWGPKWKGGEVGSQNGIENEMASGARKDVSMWEDRGSHLANGAE